MKKVESQSEASSDVNQSNFSTVFAQRRRKIINREKKKCDWSFTDDSGKQRKNIPHDWQKPYRCDYEGCNLSFGGDYNLQRHKKIHMCRKIYKCDWVGCESIFASSEGRRTHYKRHSGEKPFKCNWDGCGKSFKDSTALKVHYRIHTGERNYKCVFDNCFRSFMRKQELDHHLRMHRGERPFKCRVSGCNASFTSSQYLKHHTIKHMGENVFKCEIPNCNVSFKTRSSVLKHMRMHKGERPYSCDACEISFYDSKSLRNHVALHNKTPKLHQCTIRGCTSSFTSYLALTMHSTVHAGETPFICDWPGCHASFKYKGTLNHHIKFHTGNTMKCNYDGCNFVSVTLGVLNKHRKTHDKSTTIKRRRRAQNVNWAVSLVQNRNTPNYGVNLKVKDHVTPKIEGQSINLITKVGSNTFADEVNSINDNIQTSNPKEIVVAQNHISSDDGGNSIEQISLSNKSGANSSVEGESELVSTGVVMLKNPIISNIKGNITVKDINSLNKMKGVVVENPICINNKNTKMPINDISKTLRTSNSGTKHFIISKIGGRLAIKTITSLKGKGNLIIKKIKTLNSSDNLMHKNSSAFKCEDILIDENTKTCKHEEICFEGDNSLVENEITSKNVHLINKNPCNSSNSEVSENPSASYIGDNLMVRNFNPFEPEVTVLEKYTQTSMDKENLNSDRAGDLIDENTNSNDYIKYENPISLYSEDNVMIKKSNSCESELNLINENTENLVGMNSNTSIDEKSEINLIVQAANASEEVNLNSVVHFKEENRSCSVSEDENCTPSSRTSNLIVQNPIISENSKTTITSQNMVENSISSKNIDRLVGCICKETEASIKLNDIDHKIRLFNLKCGVIGCNVMLTSLDDVHTHLKKHISKYKFECDFIGCGMLFDTKNERKIHRKKHSGMKQYQCSYSGCKLSYRYLHTFKKHLLTHKEAVTYTCDWPGCNKAGRVFKTQTQLHNHMEVHRQTPDRPFKCTFEGCNKFFTSSGNLDRHSRVHYVAQNPFKCTVDDCEQRFASLALLKAHMRLRHRVQLVNKVGSRLTPHSRVHKVYINPFKCIIGDCEQRFASLALVKAHMSEMHGVDK